MALQLGDKRRLFVSSDGGLTFAVVTNTTRINKNKSQNLIDASSMTTGPTKVQLRGRGDLVISVEAYFDLPDTTGVEKVFDLDKTETTEIFQIRDNVFGDTDVIFECDMGIANFSETYEDEVVIGCSFDLYPVAQPTINLLKSS